MKYGQLEYKKQHFFSKIMQKTRKEDYFQKLFFLKKDALCEVKASDLQHSFNIF